MPQLNLATYASQAFWVILCFCTLWFLLSVFISPKIADILEQRKRKINDYISKAEKLNSEAKSSLEKYQGALETARTRAAADIAGAQQKLKETLEKEEHNLQERLSQQIAENEFLLAKEKNATLRQIEDISQSLAFEIVQKLGFTNITREDIAGIEKEESNG